MTLTKAVFTERAIAYYQSRLLKHNARRKLSLDAIYQEAVERYQMVQAGLAKLAAGRQNAHTEGWLKECLAAHQRAARTITS